MFTVESTDHLGLPLIRFTESDSILPADNFERTDMWARRTRMRRPSMIRWKGVPSKISTKSSYLNKSATQEPSTMEFFRIYWASVG